MNLLDIIDLDKTARNLIGRFYGPIKTCELCPKCIGGNDGLIHMKKHIIDSLTPERDVIGDSPTEPPEDLPTDEELDRIREELAECDAPPEVD